MKDGDFPAGLGIIIGAAILGVCLVAGLVVALFLLSIG
jgi:hypothetical protein